MRFSKKNEGNESSSQGKTIISLYYPQLQFYIVPIKRKKIKWKDFIWLTFFISKTEVKRAYISLIQFQYFPKAWFHHQTYPKTHNRTYNSLHCLPPSLIEFSTPSQTIIYTFIYTSNHYIYITYIHLDSLFHHKNIKSVKGGIFSTLLIV